MFFDNPKELSEKTLQRIPEETNFDKQRGQAYLLAGLIKGLGVGIIESTKILDKIEQIALD